jgi:protein-disulfide isomerase
MKKLIGVALLALAVAGCGGSDGNQSNAASGPVGTTIPAPNGGDWTETVAETPDGGVRMGNPEAPVKLVEYGSLTCPHCAEFSEEATEPLKAYVKTGRVSWEFRPYLLFPSDSGISMLLKCQGAGPFFTLTEQLYADQSNWVARMQAQGAQLQNLQPGTQAAAAYVTAGGLDQFFRERGMPQEKIQSCLADQSKLQSLVDLTARAGREGVTSTPTLMINGSIVENGASWDALKPQIDMALR